MQVAAAPLPVLLLLHKRPGGQQQAVVSGPVTCVRTHLMLPQAVQKQ